MSKSAFVQSARYRPTAGHVFVCVNRRSAGDPLGQGCGARGDAVYAALKQQVSRRGLVSSVWVSRTYCLGVCPQHGCSVALSPSFALLSEVEPTDVPALVDQVVSKKSTT